MTTASWILLGIVIYLIVGIILKNHTRIGTVQFKNYGARFIFLYSIPLGGLLFYWISNCLYIGMMIISCVIFRNAIETREDERVDNGLFPFPKFPKYPKDTPKPF